MDRASGISETALLVQSTNIIILCRRQIGTTQYSPAPELSVLARNGMSERNFWPPAQHWRGYLCNQAL